MGTNGSDCSLLFIVIVFHSRSYWNRYFNTACYPPLESCSFAAKWWY